MENTTNQIGYCWICAAVQECRSKTGSAHGEDGAQPPSRQCIHICSHMGPSVPSTPTNPPQRTPFPPPPLRPDCL